MTRRTITALCAACALGGYSSQALAETQPGQTNTGMQPQATANTNQQSTTTAGNQTQPQNTATTNADTGQKPRPDGPNSNMQGKLVKGSEITGKNLYNQQGEDIGDIQDLLVDENTGRVSHALVSTSIQNDDDANTNVAVPFSKVRQSEKDTTGYVVSIDQAKLANAPAYPSGDNAMFDDAWAKKNSQHFGEKAMTGVKLVRLSQINGAKLFDQQGNEIGKMQDTLVYPNNGGKVAYGIVDVDYVGENEVTSVPFKLIRQSKSDSPGFVLNVDKSRIEKAELFKTNEWPDYNDMEWNTRMYHYYDVDPYWVPEPEISNS